MSAEMIARPLHEVLLRIESGWSPVCESRPPGGAEWGVLGLGAVTSGKFIPDEAKKLPELMLPRESLEVKSGDVLVARANGSKRLVGVGAMVPVGTRKRLIFPDLVYRLIPDVRVLDPQYLGLVIATPLFRRQVESVMRSTSGQFKISKSDLQEFSVPMPKLAEQRRIVASIHAVQVKGKVSAQSRAKLKGLRNGWVERLNGCSWRQLGDVVADGPQNGIYKPSTSYGLTGTRIVRIDSFAGGPSELGRRLLRVDASPNDVARYGLEEGDLLVNRVNTVELVGKSTVVGGLDEPTVFESNLMRCRLALDEVIPEFVEAWMGGSVVKRHFLRQAKSAVSQASVNRSDVLACPFPVISIEEQLHFLEALRKIDSRISSELSEAQKLERLGVGLTADLLSGRLTFQ